MPPERAKEALHLGRKSLLDNPHPPPQPQCLHLHSARAAAGHWALEGLPGTDIGRFIPSLSPRILLRGEPASNLFTNLGATLPGTSLGIPDMPPAPAGYMLQSFSLVLEDAQHSYAHTDTE